jgi:hypothetical protein
MRAHTHAHTRAHIGIMIYMALLQWIPCYACRVHPCLRKIACVDVHIFSKIVLNFFILCMFPTLWNVYFVCSACASVYLCTWNNVRTTKLIFTKSEYFRILQQIGKPLQFSFRSDMFNNHFSRCPCVSTSTSLNIHWTEEAKVVEKN